MLIDANNFDTEQLLETDICIVGGGVAGLTLANELLPTGKSIVVLDAGDRNYNFDGQAFYKAEKLPQGFPDTSFTRLRMLGGSCNHWENSTERFDPIDFEKRDWVPDSGWPFSYDEIEPFYTKAEQYCGVGTDGFDFSYWKDKAGIDDICETSQDFETAISKSALPPTRFFEKLGPVFEKASNVKIVYNASVTDVDFSQENRVTEAMVFKAQSKRQHRVKAGIFCLCTGGIENARLLLSFNEKYDDSIGNQHDNVGRYFMEHPTIRGAHFYPLNCQRLPPAYEGFVDQGRFIKPRLKLGEASQIRNETNNLRLYLLPQGELIMSHGIASSHVLKDSLGNGEWPDNFGTHLVNILGDLDSIVSALSRGEDTSSQLNSKSDFAGYQIVSMIEQTPERENRILLGAEPDPLGMKKVRIGWKVSELDRKLAWKTLNLLSTDQALSKHGRFRLLHERESRVWGSQLGFSAHHMGTTRMHNSEKMGVVDKNGQVFGTRNLYVAGSSVFPTGGHVPPTLTIVALVIKMAKELSRRLN